MRELIAFLGFSVPMKYVDQFVMEGKRHGLILINILKNDTVYKIYINIYLTLFFIIIYKINKCMFIFIIVF